MKTKGTDLKPCQPNLYNNSFHVKLNSPEPQDYIRNEFVRKYSIL
jgi:hypothetical protein